MARLETPFWKGTLPAYFKAKIVSGKLFILIEVRRCLLVRNADDMSSFVWHILCSHSSQTRERCLTSLVEFESNNYLIGKEGAT